MYLVNFKMKIGAIIQARLSSSRFPRKVLKSLPYGSDTCVLQQVIRRVCKSNLIDEVIIATTTSDDDEEIVDVANRENVGHFRGSLENVLERYYLAAKENDIDVVVRITSDCPCADWGVIDKVIKDHLDAGADYTSNSLVESFPRGIDCEVINFDVLEKCYLNASEKYEQEHVTPYIYKSHPEMFKINKYFEENDNSAIRITLDTPQDYSLLCLIYEELYDEVDHFTLDDILNLFNQKPWIKYINEEVIQKKVCKDLNEELTEAANLCNIQDLDRAKKFINDYLEKNNG